MTYQDFTTTGTVILAILGGLLVIMNFVDKVRAWRKPTADKDKGVAQQLADHEQRLTNDHNRLNRLEEDNKMVLRTLENILEHMITGNSVDRMRETHKELTDYMVKR